MISVSPYKKGDAYEIEPMPELFSPVAYMKATHDVVAQNANTYAMTMRNGQKIIAIVGFTNMFPGVMEVWSLLAEDIKLLPFTTAKFARRLIEYFRRQFHVRRFQMSVINEFDTGHRWARFLGFKLEGIMEKYGPDGKDHALYGRVYA